MTFDMSYTPERRHVDCGSNGKRTMSKSVKVAAAWASFDSFAPGELAQGRLQRKSSVRTR